MKSQQETLEKLRTQIFGRLDALLVFCSKFILPKKSCKSVRSRRVRPDFKSLISDHAFKMRTGEPLILLGSSMDYMWFLHNIDIVYEGLGKEI